MANPYQQPAPQYAPRPTPRGNLPLGIVLGVIVGAIAVMFAWFAFIDDPDSATPAPAASPTPTQPVESSPTPEQSPATTPDATSPSPSAEASGTPEASPSAAPSAEPQAPIEGITTELPAGTWVTVLDSPAKSDMTPEQAIARAAELSRPDHRAVVLDTDAFEGLNRGYWAIAIPGAESREASNDVCRAIGVPVGDKCYPREIKGPR